MITVDISNIWGEVALPDLLEMEKDVFEAHVAMTERNGAGGEFLGWMDLPVREQTGEMERIQQAAQKIRGDSQVCVVVGIGTGCRGARGMIELLQGPDRNIGKGIRRSSLRVTACLAGNGTNCWDCWRTRRFHSSSLPDPVRLWRVPLPSGLCGGCWSGNTERMQQTAGSMR